MNGFQVKEKQMAAITGNEERVDVPCPTRGCPAGAEHDREVPEIDLLSTLTIRGVTFRNRIVMSPMCQYSAEEGLANDWHLVHLGSRAVGGVALVMVDHLTLFSSIPQGRADAASVHPAVACVGATRRRAIARKAHLTSGDVTEAG